MPDKNFVAYAEAFAQLRAIGKPDAISLFRELIEYWGNTLEGTHNLVGSYAKKGQLTAAEALQIIELSLETFSREFKAIKSSYYENNKYNQS